jgi:mutator protein MutT
MSDTQRPASADTVPVVAAVIERGGRLLITRRRAGTHLSGLWEFPGGKPEPGERKEDALVREIKEELGAVVSVGEQIETVEWQYPGKRVSLTFFRCALTGEPQPLEGQEMAWVAPADLSRYQFPEADAALIERLSAGDGS